MAKYISLSTEEASLCIERMTALFAPFTFDFTKPEKATPENYFYLSILTELLILMRDLTQDLARKGKRVPIKLSNERLSERYPKIKDITDLVNYFRNVACHNEIKTRRNSKGKLIHSNIHRNYPTSGEITLEAADFELYINSDLVPLYKSILKRYKTITGFANNTNFLQAIKNAEAQGYL
ncbi:MAG: hypothetical protein ACTHMM_13370 [Agriterribacter sp.]